MTSDDISLPVTCYTSTHLQVCTLHTFSFATNPSLYPCS